MIRPFRCDMHIHTCLSPCAGLEMYPSALVRRAAAKKLDVVAICDHNASENVPYVIRAARGYELTVLPGMEITSSEEVHLLALFDNMDDLRNLQDLVYSRLPGENDEDRFGCQAIVSETDDVEGFNPRLLIGATGWTLAELVGHIHERGGLAIAAHIDREAFSVISQLGFVDPEIPFDALEIFRRTGIEAARRIFTDLASYPFLISSDAHCLDDIGSGVTELQLETVSIRELKLALTGREGRGIAGY